MSLIKFILSADSKQLEDGAERGKKALGDLKAETRAGAAEFGKWAGAAAAAAAGGAAILIAKSMAAIDAQAKLAQQLRTTSESMGVLERAGDLAGIPMEKLSQGAKKLDVVMAQAAAGSKAQADIFNRLGLEVEKVAAMPLDQRIAAVNSAIAQNIPVTEKAAIAAQLFGEEAGGAFARLDAAQIEEARKQAELFGLAISDIDAAKIEMAGDAFSTIGAAADGLTKQLTIQMAPAIKAVGDMFLESAEKSGGMGNIASGAMDKITKAAAFVMNAADGIGRVFEMAADAIIIAIGSAMAYVLGKVASTMEGLNKIASALGSDMFAGPAASARAFADQAQGVVNEAVNNIKETLNEPMLGDKFLAKVEQAKAAMQSDAEASVAQKREGMQSSPTATAAPAQEDPKAAAEADALKKRLETLQDSWLTEQELMQKKLEDDLALIQEGLAAKQLTQEQAWEMEMNATLQHQNSLAEIENEAAEKRKAIAQAEAAAKQQIIGQAMNALTSLMNSGSRKMFEVGKAAAIAQSIVSTWTGATKALELGWPLGPIAAASIVAGGMANIANIRKQQFGGGGGVGGATSMPTANVNAAATGTAPGGNNAPTQRTNITLIGDSFGREQVIGLLNEALKDGFTIGGRGA